MSALARARPWPSLVRGRNTCGRRRRRRGDASGRATGTSPHARRRQAGAIPATAGSLASSLPTRHVLLHWFHPPGFSPAIFSAFEERPSMKIRETVSELIADNEKAFKDIP